MSKSSIEEIMVKARAARENVPTVTPKVKVMPRRDVPKTRTLQVITYGKNLWWESLTEHKNWRILAKPDGLWIVLDQHLQVIVASCESREQLQWWFNREISNRNNQNVVIKSKL